MKPSVTGYLNLFLLWNHSVMVFFQTLEPCLEKWLCWTLITGSCSIITSFLNQKENTYYSVQIIEF